MQFFSEKYPNTELMEEKSPTSVKDTETFNIGINYSTSTPINLSLIYLDLITILSECVAEYNKSSVHKNREQLLELLVENGHLVGITNIINNDVDNAQQIIETTLKSAVKNMRSEIVQILLTLHKSQISDAAIQENLSLAEKVSSQDIYDMLENIAHERDLMEDTPGFWYTGNGLA